MLIFPKHLITNSNINANNRLIFSTKLCFVTFEQKTKGKISCSLKQDHIVT